MAGNLPPAYPKLPTAEDTVGKEDDAGTGFAFYNQIWNVQQRDIPLYDKEVDVDVDPLKSIRREKMPKMYSIAFSEKNLSNTLAQSDPPLTNRENSETSNSETSNGSKSGPQLDLLGHPAGLCERAHLIPDAPVGSKSYGFIAEAALGLKNTDPSTRLKLVKGVQKDVGGKTQRIRQTGLKHNKYNKLRLFLPKKTLDNGPHLLIIPILPLATVLGWDETDPKKDYSYDVMICAPLGQDDETIYNYKAIYKHLFINVEDNSICTPEEIMTASELLSTFADAIATSTFNDDIMEAMTSDNTKTRNVAALAARIKEARDKKQKVASIDLPSVLPGILDMKDAAAMAKAGIRVVKARVTKKTSLPDPYLLAVKAAANWFAGRNTPMLAAGSVSDLWSDSDYDTDGSNYNDEFDPLPAAQDDPLVSLRNSLQSGSHVHVELFSCD